MCICGDDGGKPEVRWTRRLGRGDHLAALRVEVVRLLLVVERDRVAVLVQKHVVIGAVEQQRLERGLATVSPVHDVMSVSYTHLRAHETDSYLVCRLLLE